MTAAKRALSLLALGLVAGCGGDDNGSPLQVGPPVVAPAQESSEIAAVRARAGKPPSFNPPRFDLVTVREDGSGLRVLVAAPGDGIERIGSPAWSPDASRIYFVGTLSERDGRDFTYYESDVFVVDYGGGEPRRVTSTLDVGAVVPAPDGKTLLVGRSEDRSALETRYGMWLMDTDGQNARSLLDTPEKHRDFPGSWSSDGRKIAFTRCQFVLPNELGRTRNTCAVYVAGSDGSGLRKLADRASQPAFSPNGKQIAYVTDRDEHGIHTTGSDEEDFASELYVMDADGAHQRRLTMTESLDEETPSWSPEGDLIVHAREGPASFSKQLMLVRGDGSCSTLVVGNAADASLHQASFDSPAWRPGRSAGESAPLACD